MPQVSQCELSLLGWLSSAHSTAVRVYSALYLSVLNSCLKVWYSLMQCNAIDGVTKLMLSPVLEWVLPVPAVSCLSQDP